MGYEVVSHGRSSRPPAGVRIAPVSQERSWLKMADGEWVLPFAALPVGQPVQVLPNHPCLTATMNDRCYVIDSRERIMAEWLQVSEL